MGKTDRSHPSHAQAASDDAPASERRPRVAKEPPEAPEIDRKVRIRRAQMVGMPIFLAIAVANFFGESKAEQRAASGPIAVTAIYPERIHFRETESVQLWVENTGHEVLEDVRLSVDPKYLDGFTNVLVSPPPLSAYEIPVGSIRPGERRLATIEVHANTYFGHRGNVEVGASGRAPARLELSTFVLP